MTRRERNFWVTKAVQIGIVLVAFAFIYLKVKGLAPQ